MKTTTTIALALALLTALVAAPTAIAANDDPDDPDPVATLNEASPCVYINPGGPSVGVDVDCLLPIQPP